MHSKEDGCADRQKYGTGNVGITTKPTKVTKIPAESEYKLSDDSFFVHYTANETVNGVEWRTTPDVKGRLLVGDHSSNFCSKPIDWSMHAAVCAGTQKMSGQLATRW